MAVRLCVGQLPSLILAGRLVASLILAGFLTAAGLIRCVFRGGLRFDADPVLRTPVRKIRELTAGGTLVCSPLFIPSLRGSPSLRGTGLLRVRIGVRRLDRRLPPAFRTLRRRALPRRLVRCRWRPPRLHGGVGLRVRIHRQLLQHPAGFSGNGRINNDVVAGCDHLAGGREITLPALERVGDHTEQHPEHCSERH